MTALALVLALLAADPPAAGPGTVLAPPPPVVVAPAPPPAPAPVVTAPALPEPGPAFGTPLEPPPPSNTPVPAAPAPVRWVTWQVDTDEANAPAALAAKCDDKWEPWGFERYRHTVTAADGSLVSIGMVRIYFKRPRTSDDDRPKVPTSPAPSAFQRRPAPRS